jgi:hypothetical protein
VCGCVCILQLLAAAMEVRFSYENFFCKIALTGLSFLHVMQQQQQGECLQQHNHGCSSSTPRKMETTGATSRVGFLFRKEMN